MSLKYGKKDKLKSKKTIERLFNEGRSITVYPLRLVYLETEFKDSSILKTGVSVSKKHHKTAVSRNRIKRLLREAYRLNKQKFFNNSSTSYAFMILYLRKEGTNSVDINSAMKMLFQKFLDKTSTRSCLFLHQQCCGNSWTAGGAVQSFQTELSRCLLRYLHERRAQAIPHGSGLCRLRNARFRQRRICSRFGSNGNSCRLHGRHDSS